MEKPGYKHSLTDEIDFVEHLKLVYGRDGLEEIYQKNVSLDFFCLFGISSAKFSDRENHGSQTDKLDFLV